MKEKYSGDYRITLHAQPSDLPAIVRVRQLLKVALRNYGFKCVGLDEIHAVPVVERFDADEVTATKEVVYPSAEMLKMQ